MLEGNGYTVGRYVSLEQLVADSADGYCEALLASTDGWHEDRHDPWPWLTYFASIIADAYDRFCRRAAADRSGGTKQDRVANHVLRHALSTFRVAELRSALPGISDQTIRLVLDRLRKQGLLEVDGTGRSATWRRREN